MAARAGTAALALLLSNPLAAQPDRQQEIYEEATNFDAINF